MSTQQETKSRTQTNDFAGPAWVNNVEYPSIASNEFARDLVLVDQLIHQITDLANLIKSDLEQVLAGNSQPTPELVSQLVAHSEFNDQARTLLANLFTYVECERSIDGHNSEAVRAHSLLLKRRALLQSATKRVNLFLRRAPEAVLNRYLQHPHTRAEEFFLTNAREQAHRLLSEPEETLLEQMRPNAIEAWGDLYQQISTSLRCTLEGPDGKLETIGLAEANGILRDSSSERRRSAWFGIQAAWKSQEDSCAAILNGIAGWRLEEYQRRAPNMHFLEGPLHAARIRPETLAAMMGAVEDSRELGQRCVRAMARGFGKKHLDPWDLLAAAPPQPHGPERRTFKEGLNLVREAFGAINSGMADFIDIMEKNRWLEGRVLANKQNGAYCTQFYKSRSPRVFQTYMGSLSDILTLAHELGHAYHFWAIRDLPRLQRYYPMTLAETASVFSETALANSLMRSPSTHVQTEVAWRNAEAVVGFLLNIPARFDFEKAFYQKRSGSAFVTPQELGDLTETAWRKWFGDTLSETERQFWMTKLHFSITSISFYNFPYVFGYLFSLGLFARRAELGDKFFPMYSALLRDSGRMTCEELILRHLGEDITRPEFWHKCLKIVAHQVEHFERIVTAPHQ